jgi:uncharacterized membrane protein YfcA
VTTELLLLGLCVFLGFGTQAMAGFGAVVITLTLGANLMPIPELLPLVVGLVVCQTSVLAVRHRRHVDWRLLGVTILPPMAVGGAIGIGVAPYVQADALKIVFGLGVAGFALQELWRLRVQAEPKPLPSPLALLALVGSGVTQGVFASGGPLLVYVLGRLGYPKGTFRATLVVLWLGFDSVLLAIFAARGRLGVAELERGAWLLPALVAANLFGSWAHDRVDERTFRGVVFGVLLLAGLALLVPRPG